MLWKALPIAALAGSALVLAPAPKDVDFTSMPLEPAAKLAEVQKAKPITEAIAAAAKATGGVPFQVTQGKKGTWLVQTVSADAQTEVVIGPDGTVTSTAAITIPGAPIAGERKLLSEGLYYYVLKEGSGEKPSSEKSTVKVHYEGFTLDGNKFDSSIDRGEPIDFPLNRVIRGWTLGVGDMKVGEKRKLLIPGKLGYGPNGNPRARIPGNAVLVFDVELLEVKN